jgi:DNA-directed RNA polymerase I, II, and III subunit RPABC1
MADEQLRSLWVTGVNVRKMLRDRKYTVSDEDEVSFDKFRETMNTIDIYEVKEKMCKVYVKEKTREKIAVIWNRAELGVQAIALLRKKMSELEVFRAIVIVDGKITSHAQATIRNLKNLKDDQRATIETFSDKEMKVCIAEHEHVPRHIVCPPDKISTIMTSYGLTKDNFQQIKTTDPMARYLGLTKGQLVKIVRPSETMPSVTQNGKKVALVNISYRLVV